MDGKKLQRVNARLGYTQNEWLDKESEKTGISKSSLIQMAVEQYIQNKMALNAMTEGPELMDRLESFENTMEQSIEKAVQKALKEKTEGSNWQAKNSQKMA